MGKCKSTRFNMPSHSRDAALAPVAPPAGQSRPARTHPCNVQRAMRCTLGIRPVLGLFFAAFLPGARASDLPPELGDLIDPAPKVYVYRMSEIGPSVTDAISLSLHWGRLEIADQGKPWNATDVVVDRSLPFRRLIWAAAVRGYVVIHYELGGRGHGYHILVISPPNRSGKRFLVWSAVLPHRASDFGDFMQMLDAGSFNDDPRNGH